MTLKVVPWGSLFLFSIRRHKVPVIVNATEHPVPEPQACHMPGIEEFRKHCS